MAERPAIQMMRRGSFLVPIAPTDSNGLDVYPANKPLKVKITQPRSLQQHRLYWSMLDLVAENLDQNITGEDLHEWMKLKLGLCNPVRQRNGDTVMVTQSIAFDKMSQSEFRQFFDKAKLLLITQIIPGLDSEALEREARMMLGEFA